MLEQRTVGQPNRKPAKILLDQATQDIASQGTTSMNLDMQLSFGRDILKPHLGFPLFEGFGDKLMFDLALGEQLIDAQELITQLTVVDIAFDGRQGRLKRLLNGN